MFPRGAKAAPGGVVALIVRGDSVLYTHLTSAGRNFTQPFSNL